MDLLRKFYMADASGGSGGTSNGSGPIGSDDVKKARDFGEELNRMESTVRTMTSLFKDMIDKLEGLDDVAQDVVKNLGKDLQKGLKEAVNQTKLIRENEIDISQGLADSKKIYDQITATRKRQVSIANTIAQLEKEQGGKLLPEQLRLRDDLTQELNLQSQILAGQYQQTLKTEKTMGNLGKIFAGLTKIPIVGSLIDAEKVTKKMQQTAAETNSQLQTFGTGIKVTFASIGASLTDITTAGPAIIGGFIKLVKLGAEYQSKQFEAARDLGVSVEKGKELRNNFVELARNSGTLALNADQLQKSYAGVQNELGIIVKQSDEFNTTSALIERRTGASAENMATLQFAAKKSGESLMDAYQSIVGSAKAEGGRVKLAMSEKQILDGISKVSATVYENFKGNYKELAAAVIESKKLGLSLDQVNATQDQFLDFQSSISKQFEAEVLTGRDLNLNRARELALAHDTKGLMEEITKQLGSQNKWNEMNSIQQASFAESVGLSRDAVNKMYMEQEKAAKLGAAAGEDLKTQYETLLKHGVARKEIVRLLGEESVASAQQSSASEKMANVLESINNSIAQAGEKMLPLVDWMTSLLNNTWKLKAAFVAVASVLGGIVGLSIAMKVNEQKTVALQLAKLAGIQKNTAAMGLQIGVAEENLAVDEADMVTKVTTGASYLGPAAIGVGLAALAAISALGAFGGLSGGSNTGPTAPPDKGMTQPVNTATAGANSGTATATGGGGSGQPVVITVNSVVDGQTIAKSMVKHTPAVYGKTGG